MDRAERRSRTQKIIARRARSRRAVSGRLYFDRVPEPWRMAYVYEVRVGHERRWTFNEWLVKPGVLRKHNGAHGSCCVCERDENVKRDQPSLAWELENLTLSDVSPDTEPSSPAGRRKRRKDTKRWCRGKVGLAHVSHWRPTRPGSENQVLACLTCGKQLDWCFHPRWSFITRPCRCLRGLAPLSRGPPRSPLPTARTSSRAGTERIGLKLSAPRLRFRGPRIAPGRSRPPMPRSPGFPPSLQARRIGLG